VNALFLKSPKRIEALGLILVLALMVWRLMERTIRMSLRESGSKVTGWDKKPTSRPTSFMMTTIIRRHLQMARRSLKNQNVYPPPEDFKKFVTKWAFTDCSILPTSLHFLSV
jgi:hypothetical protein